ncbi:MAG: PAS domain S-box protein [Firmicutes bacterium]|nr:PAS domain S-box protein [Bacillota bacterium]
MKNFYKQILNNSPFAFSYQKIIYNESGKVIDYTFIETNPAFDNMFGYKNNEIIGKKASELGLGDELYSADFLEKIGKVVKVGGSFQFKVSSIIKGIELVVVAQSLDIDFFIMTFQDNLELIENKTNAYQNIEVYKKSFKDSPIGLVKTSLDGMLIDVNDRFCEILGYTKEELVKMHFLDITYEEDKNLSFKGTAGMKDGSSPVLNIKKRYIKKNGEIVWVELFSSLIKNSNGIPIYFETIIIDITEQEQLQKLLIESEERFKMLFDKAPLGYQSLDINGRFIEVNEKWLNILGYNREEVIGKWFGDFMTPKYQELVKEKFPIFLKNGYVNTEFEMIHKNGDILFIAFDGKIAYDKKGQFKQTHCILKDITNEHKLEKELEDNNLLIKSIIDNTSDSIYVKDTKGRYLLFNKAAERICGVLYEDILGKDDTSIFKPEEAEVVMSGDRKVMAEKQTININEVLTYKSNEEHYISSIKGPIFNNNNEIIGMFGISRDMTKSKNLEAKLEQSLTEQKLLIDNLQAGVVVYDGDYSILSCNKVVEDFLGLSLEQIKSNKASDSLWKFFKEDGSTLGIDYYPVRRILNSKSSLEPYVLVVVSKANNIKKSILINGYPILDKNNNIEKIIISFIDITNAKSTEAKLAKQNVLFGKMEKVAKIGGFEINIKNQTQSWTNEVYHILEIPIYKEESIILEELNFVLPEYKEEARYAIDNAVNLKKPFNHEWQIISARGNKKWVQVIGHPIIKDWIITDIDGSFQDITERKEAEIRLKKSEERYRLITENTVDVISVYNIGKNKFVYVSPSIEKLLGFTVEEFLNKKSKDILAKEYYEIIDSVLPKHIERFRENPNREDFHRMEIKEKCKNGDKIWVEVTTRYEYNSIGEVEAISSTRNIEERKKAEAEMQRLSYRDQLTGLYNRRFYEEELQRLDTYRNLPIALIMADVNGLKLTNDAFGHLKGDELLIRIAGILKKETRNDEIISRIGGDEFVILMPKTDETGVKMLIERISEVVNKERVDDIVVSLSLGYAVKKSSSEKMEKVFRDAEDDMYRHKLTESSSMRSRTISVIMNSLFEKNIREMHHSKRVAAICEFIATKMNFNKDEIKQIRIAGLMHDIGKIGINNEILDKKGSLTESEWDEIKKHSEVGYRILSSVNEFSEIAVFVLAHQERWDGKGYPQGLKGDNIPIEARIIAIADAFDAMISERAYRPKLSKEEAILEIEKQAGKQFDPEIVEIFVNSIKISEW